MIRDEKGRAYKIKGPNPYASKQASPLSFEGGVFLFQDLFGVPVTVKERSGRPSLRAQIEELAESEERARIATEDAPLKQEDIKGSEEMIRGLDGKPFNIDGQVNEQFDPDNPDHKLLDEIDQETIERGGAPVEYYRVIVDANVHDFYLEQRQKQFASKVEKMYAHWEPITPEWNPLGGTSIMTSEESMLFSFNRADFLERVKEYPREGSLIRTCTDGMFWEIINRSINIENEDRKLWGRHRIVCLCQKYQATATDSSPAGRGRESWKSGDDNPVRIR